MKKNEVKRLIERDLNFTDRKNLHFLIDRAKEFEVEWTVTLRKRVIAGNEVQAREFIEEDETDGEYINGSIVFEKVEEVKERR